MFCSKYTMLVGASKSISGFDPRSIVGCSLWLDGADTATMNSTPTVTTWTDKSGQGNNVVGTATYSSGTMTFNGTNQAFSNTAYVFPSNAYSMFAVYSNTTAPGATSYMNVVYGNGGYPMLGVYGSSKFVSARSVVANTGALSPNIVASNVLVGATYTPSTFSPFINGSAETTLAGTTLAATGIYVGGPTNYFNGSVSEILIYSATLTQTQRQSIEGYLAWKWGIKPSLPATHPFYSLPAFSRPFGPTDIPGCALWLDAADSSTMNSTTTVTSWTDKSGLGNTMTGTATVSGSNMTFNGSTQAFSNTTFVFPSSNYSMFAVYSNTTAPASTAYMNVVYGSGGYPMVGVYGSSKFVSARSVVANTGALSPNVAASSTVLVSATYTPSTFSPFINGSTETTLAGTTLAATGIYVGGPTNYFNGSISEILIYSSNLSTTQRQQVEGYLAAKWGLLNNLPGKTLSPLNIPGCALWYDAADASSITLNGSTVSQWSDKSGNGNHLTQGTTSAQPTYGTYLSYPGVYFNGANTQVLSTTYNQTGTGGRNTFIVFYDISTSPNIYGDPGLMYMGGSGAVGSAWRTQYIATSDALCVDIGAGAKIMTTSPNVTSMRTTRCVAMWAAPNSATVATTYVYGNGTQFTVQGANSGGLTTAVNTVGGLGTTIGKSTTSVISEILHYSTELTTAQRQSVENYLMSKWGISNVTSHPFKSIPPSTSQPPQFQEVTPGNWTRDWQPYLQRLAAANSGATASISSYSVSGSTASYPRGYGAIAPNGFLYFIGGTGVFVLNPSTNTATIIGVTNTTQYSGLVLGTNGNLYGIPYGSGTVLVITPSSSSPYGTVTTIGSALDSYQGGCLGPNGTIYALPWAGSNLLTINGNTVTQIAISPRTTTRGSVLGPDGNIYGAPWGTSLILKINPATNTSSTIACNGNTYWGASLAPNGLIYFSPFDPGSFLCLNVVGNIVTNVGSSGTYYCGEVLGPNGKLYSAPYNGSILEYNTATNSTATYSIPLVLNGTSMILAPNGNIYVGGTTSTNGYYISFSGLSQTPSSNYCLSAYTNKF